MEIHELNTFSGTLGSGDYFATDNGNDTSKVSAESMFAPLNARIDNIIAGPAPSAEEIVDARRGANDVTYPSLGDAIRDQVSDLKSDLSETTDNLLYLIPQSESRNGVSYTTKRGVITFSGTPTTNTTFIISPDFTLPAGTYTLNFGTNLAGSGVYFQFYRITGGQYDGQLFQVNTTKTFTLSSTTTIRVRVLTTANTSTNGYSAKPMLVSGSTAGTFTPYYTAYDETARKQIEELKAVTDIANGTDLNDITYSGYYIIGYATSVVNSPVESGRRYLRVVPRLATLLMQVLYYPAGNKMYMRELASGSWSAWKLVNDIGVNDTNVIETTDYHSNSALENIGVNLKIMSYNVANYNNDTSTYLSDEKRTNFKKMLYKAKADFIGLQENRQYIDANNTKTAESYLYKPIYPFLYHATSGGCIASKMQAISADRVGYTNGRSLSYATFAIGNKILLMITTHPVAVQDGTSADSEQSISARKTQYQQLFQWISGEITLQRINDDVQLSCPTYDWCIICADTNSITQQDRTNLMTYAKARDFNLANGEYIGWIETEKTGRPIDNIMVSQNVIINSVEVLGSWFTNLYSDHYPMIADITLT